ncbi:MAG: ThuA domain-containing protein [Bryobacteraceae bacterium]
MKRMLPLFLLPWLALAAGGKLRVLMLTGQTDLPSHDWRDTAGFLRSALERTGRFEVKALEETRGLNAAALAGYDALVLHYNGPRWGPAAERAVEEFLRSGRGMFALHGVSYGEFFGQVMQKRWTLPAGATGWAAYPDIVGMTWKPENIGHAARHVFEVKWTDREHPIARGLPPTFLANDELYHKMDLRPNAHVIATAFDDPGRRGTGKDEPIMWTVPFGPGRVAHLTLGHDLGSMTQPGFLAAFARGTEWAATGAVTLPAHVAAYIEPRKDAARVLVVTGGHSYPTSFYTLFEGYDDIRWSHAPSQAQAFRPGLEKRFDTIVLHDMAENLGETESAALRAFIEAGKGIVSTHHAIVDYTSWPWFYEQVTGGKYWQKKSTFKEGVEVVCTPTAAGAKHPVMRGVGPIVTVDEVYKGMWHSPDITVLMETTHPLNDPPVVYIGPNRDARVVYIQLGHDTETIRHPTYRRLVHNAILWTARMAD